MIFVTDLNVDWRELTHQRTALLAAIPLVDDTLADALEGVLNLLDALTDLAEIDGTVTRDQRNAWWREGCIRHGLDAPEDD